MVLIADGQGELFKLDEPGKARHAAWVLWRQQQDELDAEWRKHTKALQDRYYTAIAEINVKAGIPLDNPDATDPRTRCIGWESPQHYSLMRI